MSARGRRGDIAVAEGADDVGEDSDEEAAAAEEEQVGSIKEYDSLHAFFRLQ